MSQRASSSMPDSGAGAAVRRGSRGIFCLERFGAWAFVDLVLAALTKETVTVVDLSAYPDWLLVLGGTLVAAFLVWLMITLLKWALWFLFFAVLIGGLGWTAWLVIQ